MLSRSLRISRQGFTNVVRQHGPTARCAFTTTTVRSQGDLVKDLYLRELKNYKVPQPKASEADAYVQKFQVPKPPKSPEESSLASDLSAYEQQEVEVEGHAGDASAAAAPEHDIFEDDLGLDEDDSHAKH